MNLEFRYRYRDLGNFKNYGSVIFGNRKRLPTEEVDRAIVELTGDDATFVASRVGIPEMFFTELPYSPRLDWEMHEYCGVFETESRIDDTEGRDIVDLLSMMKAVRGEG